MVVIGQRSHSVEGKFRLARAGIAMPCSIRREKYPRLVLVA
jgi:hypothetical protein